MGRYIWNAGWAMAKSVAVTPITSERAVDLEHRAEERAAEEHLFEHRAEEDDHERERRALRPTPAARKISGRVSVELSCVHRWTAP